MKLVVCFPGIGYHCDKPLLYYSRKLAACAGYDHTLLLQYTYHKDGLRGSPAALREAFDTLYAQAEAQLSAVDWPQYDDVLFLSKSIGTAVSAAFAQRHGIPCRQILYTPLSLTFALAPQNALAFLGTADPWSDAFSVAAAARANGTPLCLYENANHSLETGDVLHDLATLQDVMQKTQTFIADTPHLHFPTRHFPTRKELTFAPQAVIISCTKFMLWSITQDVVRGSTRKFASGRSPCPQEIP